MHHAVHLPRKSPLHTKVREVRRLLFQAILSDHLLGFLPNISFERIFDLEQSVMEQMERLFGYQDLVV